jgi:hypothetical protein
MEDRWTPSPAFLKSKTGFFGKKGLNIGTFEARILSSPV